MTLQAPDRAESIMAWPVTVAICGQSRGTLGTLKVLIKDKNSTSVTCFLDPHLLLRNRALFTHPLQFAIDCTLWFVNLICGCVSINTVFCGASQGKACVISRVSCERAGARFLVRC